jgi:uncharacterized protein YkwD
MLARGSRTGIIRCVRLSALIAVLVLAGVGTWALWPRNSVTHVDPCGPVDQPPQESGLQVAGQTTICLLNRQRSEHGLPALRENTLLTQASVEHSQDMVRLNYFEHTTPDGRSVEDRLRTLGYQRGFNASAGENIAYGVGDKASPAAIVGIWMNSPPHRADILRPAFREIGIGIAVGAPEVDASRQAKAATYTTDFGGVPDPSLPNG